MSDGFNEKLKIGTNNEHAMIFVLNQKQYFITPLAKIRPDQHGGPRLIGPNGHPMATAIVLPDCEADAPDEHFGLEFKWKAISTFTRQTQEQEQGIGIRKLESYKQWEKIKARQMILMITEGSTGEVLARSLRGLCQSGDTYIDNRDGELLRPRFYHGPPGPGVDVGGMAYFGRKQFKIFHQGAPNDMPLFKRANVQLPPTLPTATTLSDL